MLTKRAVLESGFQPKNLSKKRPRYRYFTLNFVNFFRKSYLLNISGQQRQPNHRILLQTVPIAIANNTSQANYQNGFVLFAF